MAEPISPEELNLLIEQTYKVEKEFTELKQSYTHLQDTVEQIVEFLPNAIWILDKDNHIFLQNSKAKDLEDLFELLEFENDDYEINFNSSSYLIKSSLYQDKKMLSCTDITEQKRKENLATMGQMAAHLSHEIRNPIGSISLLSSTLKKKVKPENIIIVDEIQKAVYKIDRIIKATLMFSKGVKATKKDVKWMKIKESLDVATMYYGYCKDINFVFPQDDFVINGDKDLLEMLFSNFVINAIDAIELDDEDSGVVEIIYDDKDKDFHIFKIYDTGIAIENKDELFQAFKSTKVKGNGLGLVLSEQIAKAHGGDVSLLKGDKKGFMIRLIKNTY
jgi:two-component system NtrC family sensor kinase/two-component system sensor histidine kinase AtoS